MKVIAVKFENYRNLKNDIIQPCDGVNIIYGDNAQGKTNLLEAIWLFCGGHSFRSAKDSEVIRWDENYARLEMRFFGQEREQTAKLVFTGNKKQLEINGVGYRAQKQGNKLVMNLGYSHPVEMEAPEGITFDLADANHITVRGIDKELVGQTATVVRSKRPPEVYRGKGIKYATEHIRRKEGKAGKK